MKNFFQLNKLKNIVFIGANQSLETLIKINSKLNINSFIATSKDQKKMMNINHPYVVFDSININFKNYIKKNMNINETLFISLSSRWIFKKKDINNFFKKQLINFHPSRLPIDSGGGGYTWRIINNDRISNLLIHQINEKIDDGPIIFYETRIFPHSCKIPQDYFNFENNNIKSFYEKFIKYILKGHRFKLIQQPAYLKTYFPRLDSSINSWIDWSIKDVSLINFINAFDNPYSGAKTKINNISVVIKKAHLHGGEVLNHEYFSGLIIRKEKNFIVVATGYSSVLLIEEVLDRSKNNIVSKLKLGDRFHTPSNLINKSLKERVYFNSRGKISK